MAHTRPHQDDDNDDDIFFLLNGIHKKTTHQNKNDVSTKSNTAGGTSSKIPPTFDESDIEMFVDINGLPTDTFLESLKQDALAASEALNRKLVADEQFGREEQTGEVMLETGGATRNFTARKEEVHYQSRYLDSSSESDTEDYQDSSMAPHRRHNSFFQHLQHEKQLHGVGGARPTPSQFLKKKKDTINSRKPHKKAPSTRTRTHTQAQVQTHATSQSPGHATPIPVSTLKQPHYTKQTRGLTTTGLNYLSSSLDTGRSATSKRSVAGGGRMMPPRSAKKKTNRVTTSQLRVSQGEGDAIAALNLTKQVEGKNEALKLRLQGQLNSIRVLETKVAEAEHSIAVRDLELANALRRVTQLESREKDKVVRKDQEEEGLRRSGPREDSKLYQMKTELIALQARFNDEKSRRGRTEERLRIIKEHCDKQKARVSEVEEKNTELEGVLKALHEKFQKKKHEVKTSSKEINAARVKVVEKDTALQTCKNHLLRSERCAKDLRHDNDRLKEELRVLRREANISDDKNRRNTLEIEVLRERQNATKLAYRLQNQSQNLSFSSNVASDRSRSSHSAPIEKRRSQSVSSVYSSASNSNNNRSRPSKSSNSSALGPDGGHTRPCPYSKPRRRSQSTNTNNKHRRKHKNIPGGYPGCNTCGNQVDLDSGSESQDSSVDPGSDSERESESDSESSYDMEPLLAHHDSENDHINNRMSEHLPPPPPEEDINKGDVQSTRPQPGDVSLLSDSSGMGEQFNRLQKMYARVQGNKKH